MYPPAAAARRRLGGSTRDVLCVLLLGLLLFGTSLVLIAVATPKGHAAADAALVEGSDGDGEGGAGGGSPLDELFAPGGEGEDGGDSWVEAPVGKPAAGGRLRQRAARAAAADGDDGGWGAPLQQGKGGGGGRGAAAARRPAPAALVGAWGSEDDGSSPAAAERADSVSAEASSEILQLKREIDELRSQLAAAQKKAAAKPAAAAGAAAVAKPPPAASCPPVAAAARLALPAAAGASTDSAAARARALSAPRPKAFMPDSNGRTLLRAWRARQLDWHDIVKPVKPMSDSGAAGEYRMKLLVQGELDAISYLQGFLGFRGGSDGAAADPADVSRHYAPGADWGPMAKYGACPIVRDKCMVHATDRECVLDELCGWCASRLLCVDRLTRTRPELVTGDPVPVCPHPLLVLAASADAQAGRLDAAATGGLSVLTTQGALGGSPGSAADCGLVVTRNRPLQVHLVGNAKMLFHFATENAGTLHSSFDAAGAVDDLGAHVWIPADSTPEFLEFMHGYSDACYRWTYEVPAGGEAGTVCYTNNKIGRDGGPVRVALWDAGTRAPAPDPAWDSDPALAAYKPTGGASDGDSPGVTPEADAIAAGMRLGLAGIARWLRAEDKAAEAAAVEVDGRKSMFDFLIHVMGLWDVAPSLPHVTLLSRRNKRLILNEPELLAAVVEGLGGAAPADSVAVELASLETMTLYEQLALFRRTTVLAGIHGSGLINSIFMHPGTALVQLMPFNVQSGASFFAGPAASTGVAYFEWTNPKRENTVYHWHFLGRDHAGDREQLVTCGSSCGGPDVYFSFHINQDTWVDVDDWRTILLQAFAGSDVNKRLFPPRAAAG